MNRQEHLLCCLAEECAEVAQRVSKALRFGLEEVQPGQDLTNADRIRDELHDLISVALMAYDEGLIGDPWPSGITQGRKVEKIERYLHLSRALGTLVEVPG